MKKILAIDDQQDNLLSIKALAGYYLPDCKLFLAQSGEEGIAIAKKEQPDTILLDIIMPKMDGYEVCKILKQDERTKNIPILMLSALGQDTEIRVKGLDLGADAFLAKPFIPTELKSQINVMLRIKEVEDKLRAEKVELEDIVKKRTKELQIINIKQKKDIIKLTKTEEELKIALEKATESDRLKTAFLQNISHEIRTPMNGILGFSGLLKNPGLTGEEQQSYVNVILTSGNRMLNTINDLMDISKLETGQEKLKISLTNVNKHLNDLFTFFKPEVERKSLQLEFNFELPDEDANINTDSQKLYAILSNLIKNAIKYTHKGSIDFGYTKKGNYLEFYVVDTGIGIPTERQEAIFERFVKSDIEDKMVYEGSGLGLSISKAYVDMLGGEIMVESDERKGARFCFTIPYNTGAKEIIENKAKVPESESVTNKRKLKILIAEDDELVLEYLNIILQNDTTELLTARSGLESVNICRKYPDIDLILMDIKMPVMDGYEATKQIRKFNKSVMILAQTAYALVGDREKAIEAGCDDYISKPINEVELLAIIDKMLKKRFRPAQYL